MIVGGVHRRPGVRGRASTRAGIAEPLSIAPPSDIVLDVAQAADPLKLQAATAKLARMAAGGGAGGADFAAALDAASAPPKPAKPLPSSFGTGTTLWRTTPAAQPRSTSAYEKFEAVILQNFVQNILPKDESLFGDAASADIVRSMLAEQLATQLAQSGRLGIAKMMAAAAHSGDQASGNHPVGAAPPAAPAAAVNGTPQTPQPALAIPSPPDAD